MKKANASIIIIGNEILSGRTQDKNIEFIECDITNKKSVDNSFKKISFDLNKLEILINNASLVKQIGTDKLDSTYIPFLKMKKEEWEEYFSVDLTGTLHLCQKVIPYMKKNSKGSIINISSTYGILSPDQRIYSSLSEETSEEIEKPIGWSLERIYELFPRLGERRKQEGTTLSGGEQQMLAIGRALARDIKLLLLDEPYEGLAPVIVQEIEKTLRLIREQGITTIIVEQNAVAALKLADRAVILDTGGVVFSGTAKEVLENEELRHEYLAI